MTPAAGSGRPRARHGLVVWLAVVASLLFAACAEPDLTETEAQAAVVDAFARAGVSTDAPSGATIESVDLAAGDDGTPRQRDVWLVSVMIDGEPWRVGVDPKRGSVVRTFEPAGSALSDRQVEALARYRAPSRSPDRTPAMLAVVGTALVAGYLVLRWLAARDRSRSSPDDLDLIDD